MKKKEALWYYEYRCILREQYIDDETNYYIGWQIMTKKEFENYIRKCIANGHEVWDVKRRKPSRAEWMMRHTPQYKTKLEAALNGEN